MLVSWIKLSQIVLSAPDPNAARDFTVVRSDFCIIKGKGAQFAIVEGVASARPSLG